jgi:16S rRNA (cytosine967-C5)-methyltransferase
MCNIELRKMSERLALSKAMKALEAKDFSAIALAHRLVIETTRMQNLIDYILKASLKPNLIDALHPEVRAFLRLFTSETRFGESRSHEKATSIASIGRSILGWRTLYDVETVFGLLLGLNPTKLQKGLTDAERISLNMFQPRWFTDYCFKLLGRPETLQLFKSNLSNTPTYVRINSLKATEEGLLDRIEGEGVVLEKVEDLQHAYKVVQSNQPLARTKSYKTGLIYIQDKASSLATEVASPKAGMTVVDVCAAPGVKTTHLAQLMEDNGAIYSVDYSTRRMKLWKREVKRMGVTIALPLVADAFKPLPFSRDVADLVILDPPCTSTGVFSRMPSAKWRLSERSIRHMAKIQWKMLSNCADLVRPDGLLVYLTCSVTVEENEILIEKFLKLHPEFRQLEATPRVGCPGLRGQTKSQRLYPHLHDCNGFFIAKLEKRN